MSLAPAFDRSVFINCPFDSDFAPLLQAIAFSVVDLGFSPRLAPENSDASATRLTRILDLIRGSRYAIHDLSRSRSSVAGEFARLNMPFELGIDHAARVYGGGALSSKTLLVLESQRYDYQKSLSDIAGWDIRAHGNDYQQVIRHVRDWLVSQAGAPRKSPTQLLANYATFQEWYIERELAGGATFEDALGYPTMELIGLMQEWVALGRPY